uniref:Uncharacterized protein n=1 Tax=Vespula pensylvanica TaxID=30213 RepID=A0A834PH66_VESPE|nr:hypothetical protein H0235_002050 [Vespula pensylvanica]
MDRALLDTRAGKSNNGPIDVERSRPNVATARLFFVDSLKEFATGNDDSLEIAALGSDRRAARLTSADSSLREGHLFRPSGSYGAVPHPCPETVTSLALHSMELAIPLFPIHEFPLLPSSIAESSGTSYRAPIRELVASRDVAFQGRKLPPSKTPPPTVLEFVLVSFASSAENFTNL